MQRDRGLESAGLALEKKLEREVAPRAARAAGAGFL